MLELIKITMHEAGQAREEINETKITEYAEHISNGGNFPPIIVFFDSTNYWLADGWHRFLAHKRIGCLTILEEVHVGGQRDALKYALGANSKHGLPRTNADKRKAVGIALNDAEWSKLPTREIAEMCNVSHNLVAEMQRGLTPSDKTAKNNSVTRLQDPTDSNVVIGLQPTKTVNNSQDAPKEPEYEPVEPPEPVYTELDEAHDTISVLQDIVSVGFMEGTEDDKNAAKELIASLRNEVKMLKATLAAVTISRDGFQRENAQMMTQMARQRKEIDKLKSK